MQWNSAKLAKHHYFYLTLIIFQIGWLLAVIGHSASFHLLLIPIIIGYYYCEKRYFGKLFFNDAHTRRRYFQIFLIMLSGIIVDYLLATFGLIEFSDPHFTLPLWLILLWGLFSITFHISYYWLPVRSLSTIIFGATFGPLSYWIASNLEAVNIIQPLTFTLVSSLFWACIFSVQSEKSAAKIYSKT